MLESKGKQKPKVVVILGPTASGKTELSLDLAEHFGGEIISADSRQVYKGLDIGTSKITSEQAKRVPHYLIDIATPDNQIYLPQYQTLAFEYINKILKRGKLPFIVGGTGLYLSSIVENYQIPNVAPQPKLRSELNKLSANDLVLRLKEVDPEAAELIYQQNKVKLIRAIEFSETSGKSFFGSQKKGQPKHNYLILGVEVEREELYQRINARTESMLEMGLEQEVRQLVDTYGWDAPALMSIGYREWRAYFEKRKTKEEIIEEIKKDSRNYAKRQMTWYWRMEKFDKINWVTDSQEAYEAINYFLKS